MFAGHRVDFFGLKVRLALHAMVENHADAVAQAVKLDRRQEPNPEATPFYLARYAEYKRLLEAMQGPWDHLSKLSQ